MHKIGLKIWSTNDFYIKPALKLFEEKVFDYIELYVVPGSASKSLNQWTTLNIPFILHAPHSNAGFNFSLEDKEKDNRNLLKEVEVFRKALNPKKVIFHPGTNGSIKETIRQIELFQKEFSDLFKIAIMENKPKVGIKGEDCIGASVEEIKNILDVTGLPFCLDMGHATCYAAWKGVSYEHVIDRFLQLNPQMYHISDGDVHSKTDMHLNFGKGNFNLPYLISLMPDQAYVSIETDKRSKSDLEDFKDDALYFREHAEELQLSDVKDSDCKDLYDWRNHPIVRKNSYNTESFSFENHQKWFQEKLQSQETTIYIAYSKSKKIGMIRFEDQKDMIQVSVMLNPQYIGQGLGKKLIELGVQKFKQRNATDKAIVAQIKQDNVASIKAFEKAGFQKNDLVYVFKGDL
jgi:deoxyribonuclease-4